MKEPNARLVLTGLERNLFLRAVHVQAVVDSTNLRLAEWVRAGRAGPGVLLAAETQTRGRGRIGRSWFSVPGQALTFSFTIENYFPRHPGRITVGTALAVAEAIQRTTGIDPAVKWPNDLCLGTGKAGGVLAEAARGPDADLLVVGVGLNVNAAPSPAPARHELPPVSLKAFVGRTVDRNRLLRVILEETDRMVRRFEAGEFRFLASALRRRSFLLGRRVRFAWNRRLYEGRLRDHTEELGILLETPHGPVEIPGAFATLCWFEGLPGPPPPPP